MLSCFRASAGRRGLVQGARPVWALCVVSTVRRDGERWVEEMGVFCEVISPRPTPPDPAGADSWSAEVQGPRWLAAGRAPLLDTVEACEWSTPTKTVPRRACWTLASSFSVFLRAKEPSPPTRCADVGPITRSGNGQKPQPFISFFPHAMPLQMVAHPAKTPSQLCQHPTQRYRLACRRDGNGKWEMDGGRCATLPAMALQNACPATPPRLPPLT